MYFGFNIQKHILGFCCDSWRLMSAFSDLEARVTALQSLEVLEVNQLERWNIELVSIPKVDRDGDFAAQLRRVLCPRFRPPMRRASP